MSKRILDASAVLAYLHQEHGHETIRELLNETAISAVNLSEAAAKLREQGASEEQAREILSALGLSVVPFDEGMAYRAASLRLLTRRSGLSLGDRACLATAEALNLPAVTSDRSWSALKLPVKIQTVR